MTNDLSKPIGDYPLARPEDLPAPPSPGAPGEPAGTARRSAAEVAVLEFLDPDKLRRTVTLDHPFRFDGAEVREVTVRALSVLEVGTIAGEARADEDLYRYFAAMTGLPAAVLRAMPADDGGRVLEACDPFLPRFLTA
jgi:Phage tail assembly chaperone proteins, E, or 41 or 14